MVIALLFTFAVAIAHGQLEETVGDGSESTSSFALRQDPVTGYDYESSARDGRGRR